MDTTENPAVDEKKLEESFTASLEELRKSIPLEKAKGKKKEEPKLFPEEEDEDEYESEEDEGEEEEEEELPPKKKVKKSLADVVADDNIEAGDAMDIEPFLKSLVIGIEKVLDEKVSEIKQGLVKLSKSVAVQGQALASTMELQKSVSDTVRKIGETPLPKAAVLSKSAGRFPVAGKELSKSEIMDKATELCKAGKVSLEEVTILESRLNRGAEIPERLKALIEQEVK